MGGHSHENRFVSILQCIPEALEIGQEVSLPRKRRRLDLVYRFDAPPPAFGPLARHVTGRAVIFEHVSQPLEAHSAHAALFAQAWLALERLERRKGTARRREAWQWLTDTARAPLAIIVGDHVSENALRHVPGLAPAAVDGLWQTPDLDRGGLLVVCPDRLPQLDGWTFWRWWGRAEREETRRRMDALQDDETMPTSLRHALEEAIVEKRIPAEEPERISVAERLRQRGRMEGERATLLAVAERLFRDEVPRLRTIEDLQLLRSEVDTLLTQLVDCSGLPGAPAPP